MLEHHPQRLTELISRSASGVHGDRFIPVYLDTYVYCCDSAQPADVLCRLCCSRAGAQEEGEGQSKRDTVEWGHCFVGAEYWLSRYTRDVYGFLGLRGTVGGTGAYLID